MPGKAAELQRVAESLFGINEKSLAPDIFVAIPSKFVAECRVRQMIPVITAPFKQWPAVW